MITAGALLDFALEHKKDKVFIGFTDQEIAGSIIEALRDETLFYTATDGKVTGFVLGYKIPESKTIFVTENLAMNLETLSVFARMARLRFPGWKLEAMRHNNHRKFDTTKLYRKLKAL